MEVRGLNKGKCEWCNVFVTDLGNHKRRERCKAVAILRRDR